MVPSIKLPQADRTLRNYLLSEPPIFQTPRRAQSRVLYAAAHVVADPLAENRIGAPAKLDWEATLAFRRNLWSLGLGVAEAMDTAQRGMGLDWAATKELIRRSANAAKRDRFAIVCGAGTDQLVDGPRYSIHEIVNAEHVDSARHKGTTTQMDSIARLSINQQTLRNWKIPELLEGCVAEQIRFVSLWREKITEIGLDKTVCQLRNTGIKVASLCRGGFFPAATTAQRRKNFEENCRAVDEAAAVGATVLVLVCGGIADHDIDRSRTMVIEGIERLLPYAEQGGVKLGIEPLHPMFAADRSVIVSLSEANGIIEIFRSRYLGVVIDVYHVWWDPAVSAEIARASGHIFGFHVNDWIVPVPDILNGRGMMGDGVIEIQRLRELVTNAGYTGPIEVEIFNEKLWRMPGIKLLQLIKERFLTSV